MKSLHLLLQRFADAGLEFVVVGGFAGVLHGSSYVTENLDICAVLTSENIGKLRTALADLHPVHRMSDGWLDQLFAAIRGDRLEDAFARKIARSSPRAGCGSGRTSCRGARQHLG